MNRVSDLSATPVRMQDVATAAGVCRATVCFALRNDPCLPESTRRRIQRIARKLGYRPNPLVAALMANLRTGRSRNWRPTIAYVTDYYERAEQLLTNPYHLAMFEGARVRAESVGFRLETFFFHTVKPRRLSEVLHARRIGGLLVGPLLTHPRTLDFRWEWFSCAAIGTPMSETPLHAAQNNQYQSLHLALRKLRALGYQRCGLVLEKHWDLLFDNIWTASYLTFARNIPPRDRMPALLPAIVTDSAFLAWFKRHRPQAIVTATRQIVGWLETLGLHVPRDVGLCHIGLPPDDRTSSGLDQNPGLIGAAAADLIIEQMQHNETGLPAHPKTILIESRWVPGQTLRRKPLHAG